LGYGLQVKKAPRIIRFTGHYLILACITCDIEQIQIAELRACPPIVRSPENEDSEAETGLKFQEDSDNVEANSE